MILATTKSVAGALAAVPLSTWMRIGAGIVIGTQLPGLVSDTLHAGTGFLVRKFGSGEVLEAAEELGYAPRQPRG